MIDENVLVSAIHEQQADDDKSYNLLYFDDRATAIYRAKKSVRDKIIETIENINRGEQEMTVRISEQRTKEGYEITFFTDNKPLFRKARILLDELSNKERRRSNGFVPF